MIIGITGTIGSGKDTLMELLKNEYGFKHYSVREYLVEKLEADHVEVNRTAMTNLANALREENHPAYIIEQLFYKAKEDGGNVVIESIRTPGEVEFLKEHADFHLFAVDADPNLRYERVQERKTATDRVDFNTFMAEEQREMNNEEPHMQNIAACVRLAEHKFKNNASIDMFYKKVRKVLEEKLEIHANTN
ncbi:MAG: AAA family ATPase [Chitinophagales bacterium]|nr:AAA family ATPase [Chitinophagales bacterium]